MYMCRPLCYVHVVCVVYVTVCVRSAYVCDSVYACIITYKYTNTIMRVKIYEYVPIVPT